MTVVDYSGYGSAVFAPLPGRAFALIGLDGNHFAIADAGGNVSNPHCLVGCAETATVVFSRTRAQWNTDITTVGTANGWNISGTYDMANSEFIAAIGTEFFYIIGQQFGTSLGNEFIATRYKINSAASITLDGGVHYGATTTTGLVEDVWGQGVFNNIVYAACSTGTASPNTLATHMIQLPLSGSYENTAGGAWLGQITLLPYENLFYEETAGTRGYYTRSALISDPSVTNGIGILSYVGIDEVNHPGGSATLAACSQPTVLYTVVDMANQTTSGIANIGTSFGMPFPDIEYLYTGILGSNPQDDYVSPSVIGNKVAFLRGFSDSQTNAAVRWFSMNGVGSITALTTRVLFSCASVAVTTGVQAIFLALTAPTTLMSMEVDAKRFIFVGNATPFPASKRRSSVRWL